MKILYETCLCRYGDIYFTPEEENLAREAVVGDVIYVGQEEEDGDGGCGCLMGLSYVFMLFYVV